MRSPTETAEFFIHINQQHKAKIVLDLLKPYAHDIFEINQLGKLYYTIKDFVSVLELAYKIYKLVDDPDSKFDARSNIIHAYLNLNKPNDALTHILLNEKEKPFDHPTQMDKAMAYFLLDEKTKGEETLRKILAEPHSEEIDNKVRFNLGTYDLRNGNFKSGLQQVLLGGKKINLHKQIYNFPKDQQWTGEIISDQTILVCAEGGIGDEIISVRFMKHIKELGMIPIWYTDRKDLAKVFNRCGFETVSKITTIPKHWLWAYSMPIPCYLDLNEDSLWSAPYLAAINNAPQLLGKKKIGIKTIGNPAYEQDIHRSIPFNELVDCIPEDYTIYSFHIDEEFEHPRVISLKDKINSWDDTLDYINQMDIIVSSCTSLIHAAGAIGKESIVIVPILTYYTWARPERKTKWYGDNLTILRQTQHNNWDSSLTELKNILNEC